MKARFALLTLAAGLVALVVWAALAPSEEENPSLVTRGARGARGADVIDPSSDTDFGAGLGDENLGAGELERALGRTAERGDAFEAKDATGENEVPEGPIAATPPPEVPYGTVVMGRLVDGDGKPVDRGDLKLSRPGAAQTKHLTIDAEGRFAVAVGHHGEVTLWASAEGVGRSVDLDMFLPEDQATDVGELRLLGAEVIRGHVRFPNGEPVPGIYLHARATDPLATPGLRRASTESDADGSFQMTALAPGLFDFEAVKDEGLPLLGESSIRAGEERAVLTVDAALLTVSCVNDAGETVPMRGLQLSNVLQGEPGEDDDVGSTSRGWSSGQESFDLFVQPQRSYMMQAHDAEIQFYFAYLEGDLTAGTHDVTLRPDPPNLAAIKVSVPSGLLDGEAQLSLPRILRNGHDVRGALSVGQDESGAAYLAMKGLVPGSYELTAAVTDSDWVALEDPERSFELTAGATEEFRMTAFAGGRVELELEHASSVQDTKTRATVQIRRAGEAEWSNARWLSKRGRVTTASNKVWIDGTLARSVVLEPGSYSIRVEAEGYLPNEVQVMVEPRATSPRRVTLGVQ